MIEDRSDRYCVIGAGSSGLTAAKNLLERHFNVDVLERESDLGGNWNAALPCSRVYRSTRMISSKGFTAYTDFPMPERYPDYPHHSQVLDYLRGYASAFGVDEHVEYGTGVERITPAADCPLWEVQLSCGAHRRYQGVVIANGHNWSPRIPSYPGQFTGRTLHSAEYKSPDIFAGKRVLVVGGGNSGCDIAVEAAQAGSLALHSTRRGYHYVPKYLFGRPSDLLADRLAKLHIPLRIRRAVIGAILRVSGGPQRLSRLPKPDHKLFETHPIVNSLLPYYVQHGAIQPRPEIAYFAGDRAHFLDGSSASVDVVVFATGYNVMFPFIDNELLNWRNGRPQLYQHIFHPVYDNLFVAGLIQPDSGMFGMVDRQCQAVAMFLSALREGLPIAQSFCRRKQLAACALAGIRYKESPRHYLEVEHWDYAKQLERLTAELNHKSTWTVQSFKVTGEPQRSSGLRIAA